ncbi:MAG: chemotaxis protein CheW [Spirochaetae bacterium HGW-Spirochaetae-10]|nr:MAG: chemotaxis protein CheW [Spirochaetae bacterium HGW-Spirochaetae-10]
MAVLRVNANQYLTFRLGSDEFGIEILKVREILEHREPTRVPRTSRFIAGVINLRGNVIPVVDLARLFQGRAIDITRRTCILILEVPREDEDLVAGILVDTVNEVVAIPPENIDPPPSFGARIRTDFIRGMGRFDDRIVILLNPASMLDFDEISALAREIDPEKLKEVALAGARSHEDGGAAEQAE